MEREGNNARLLAQVDLLLCTCRAALICGGSKGGGRGKQIFMPNLGVGGGVGPHVVCRL